MRCGSSGRSGYGWRMEDPGGRLRRKLFDEAHLRHDDSESDMAKSRSKSGKKRRIEQYDHTDKQRVNNPPVGLVTPQTDPPTSQKRTYQYDPHLDPQLVWAGKAEHTSFEVPTVSLHVHERIDPRTVIEAVRRRNANGNGGAEQLMLFDQPAFNPPLRQAIEFYKHAHGWVNRLIAGDSLLVMNSLLEKEGMAGKVQMVYIDPPYGIRYGSNFQPFVNKRDVKDGKDADLSQEPEMIRAFRDTWELGIHSYLTYLRDRLLAARELLHESGSCFVQIGDENVHLVRGIMDEVFGPRSCVGLITFKKKGMPLGARLLEGTVDYLLWYARDKDTVKYHPIFASKDTAGDPHWDRVELPDGTRRKQTREELKSRSLLPDGSRVYQLQVLYPAGVNASGLFTLRYEGQDYSPPAGFSWKTNREGMERLAIAHRLEPYAGGRTLRYVYFLDDYPVSPLNNLWADLGAAQDTIYVVQTNVDVVGRCMIMTTDPGDLVFDPTCGSGTTAYVAERWGRRWITCDTSRVAMTLAKQRLMTAVYDYYELAHPDEGVASGFRYKTVPHVTLKSIANNPEIREGMTKVEIDHAIAKYADQEVLYDQPHVDKSRARVAGPLTIEAVPAPSVRPLAEVETEPAEANVSVGRSGETVRQDEWRGEMLRCGIRGKSGQQIRFSRVEPLAGTRWLHADAETDDDARLRAVVSFGPQHAPLEQRQVAEALEEANNLVPKPKMVAFAAFQFDPEAAKDIDETNWPGVTLLKVQMNTDLLTDDLKKKRASNESFWMVGQPDVEVRKIGQGEHSGKWEVEVHGFDYYNPITGMIESGDTSKIAMWMLDTDYDGRSLYPRQVFFPMAGEKDGWARLARSLKAEIDDDLIESYRGTVSLPFEPGEHKRVAVKIIDDRGIESLRIIDTA